MKKVYLLTACVLALSLSACDSKEQNQTTTKTDTPTTPTTPVEPAQNIEPTTPAATAPFAINITDIKDFYGNLNSDDTNLTRFINIHLIDANKKILKTLMQNMEHNIKEFKFENLEPGKKYGICLQIPDHTKDNPGSYCTLYYAGDGKLSFNKIQLINSEFAKILELPKHYTIKVSINEKKYFGPNIRTDILSTNRDVSKGLSRSIYKIEEQGDIKVLYLLRVANKYALINYDLLYNQEGEEIVKIINAQGEVKILKSKDFEKIETYESLATSTEDEFILH